MPGSPTYSLSGIQDLVRANAFYVTGTALSGAWQLQWDRTDIADCILNLDAGDFHKSVPSFQNSALMQDVYRPVYLGVRCYLKLQLTSQAVVISFKEDWAQ